MSHFYHKAITLSCLITTLALSNISLASGTPTFDVVFGYGTFNMTLNVTAPIQQLSFNYGNPNFQLNAWGPISSTNANVTITNLNNGLYHYEIAPRDSTKPFQPINNQITLQQLPLLTNSPPTKNMNWDQYYGIFQQLQINGSIVNYAEMCQDAACNNPLPEKILAGYYADWSVYPSTGSFRPQYIDFTKINTLFYAFGSVDSQTGDALMFDPYADADMADVNGVPYLALRRMQYPYLTLSYSFGGWGSPNLGNYQSGDMSLLFTYHPEKIQHFADTLISFINRAGFNAIDIDYEWNAPQVPNPPNGEKPLPATLTQATADGYVTLLYDIRHASTLPADCKLTVALPAGKPQIEALANFKYQGSIAALQGQSDLSILANTVTTIDLMTYDYHGAFDSGLTPPFNVTDFLAPISIAATDPTFADPILKTYNIEGSVNAIKQADPMIKNSQLIIGIPAYGRLEQVDTTQPVTVANRGVFLPLAQNQTPASGELGNTVVNYDCLTHPQQDCANNYALPADMQNVLGPFNATDPIGNAVHTAWAYSVSKNQFISFDSAATAQYKGQWIKQNGFAGAMLWELDGDLNKHADTDYASNSILMNLYQGMQTVSK